MGSETAQITGLGQDGEGGDWTNAWDPPQELVVRALRQERIRQRLDLMAYYEQTEALSLAA